MWPPRAVAEEVDRLDIAGVVVAAALVHRDDDGRGLPQFLVGLHLVDDLLREGLEDIDAGR